MHSATGPAACTQLAIPAISSSSCRNSTWCCTKRTLAKQSKTFQFHGFVPLSDRVVGLIFRKNPGLFRPAAKSHWQPHWAPWSQSAGSKCTQGAESAISCRDGRTWTSKWKNNWSLRIGHRKCNTMKQYQTHVYLEFSPSLLRSALPHMLLGVE